MAKKPNSKRTRASKAENFPLPESSSLVQENHPHFQNGLYSENVLSENFGDETARLTPLPDGPIPHPFPIPQPRPGLPFPQPFPIPQPGPTLPLQFCGPVSGRYTLRQKLRPFPFPRQPFPLKTTQITVRVDVDRFYPQNRISIEAQNFFPRRNAHIIAEVTSDRCLGFFRRRIEAQIHYRDGDTGLIPGDRLVFEANRTKGLSYSQYRISLITGDRTSQTHDLVFQSPYFDSVEFEVDSVENAGAPVTTYDTSFHPTRPTDLPSEIISLQTTYQRAGFNVSMSPNLSNIPISGAGGNSTWSDAEMHNAMITFWSRFADRPQWAMWVLFAARHDLGRGLGGVMFDDIGQHHRQGTAIFTDSFIQDAPAGDPNPAAWRQRMIYWTAVHEMGHAFNLAHAWQKSLGRPQVQGDPWIPLIDDPESRSFMNYPFRVSGGESAFFADFEFRFSDDELIFMRHAPRRFVQMGNENWFEHHGFENDPSGEKNAFRLQLRPNREQNRFSFLEPVHLELKLTNTSGDTQALDKDLLADGRHIAVLIRREGGRTRKWRPFITYCHHSNIGTLKPGESVYASHFVGASPEGWLVDEPGFYAIQAAVIVSGQPVRSNVLRIYVSPPAEESENVLASDYFCEDVARVLAFQGAPALGKANGLLWNLTECCPGNPAAIHAAVALSNPMLRQFKILQTGETRNDLSFSTDSREVEKGSKIQMETLVTKPDVAAQTLGHISYFSSMEHLSKLLEDSGEKGEAIEVQKNAVETMERRNVLKSVVDAAKRRIDQMKR